MDDQVFLTLVKEINEDQDFEISNMVTLLELIEFFQDKLQLQIDDSDGIQCVNKPENIFYQDQFHLNMKELQQITGERNLKFKIVKRQSQQHPLPQINKNNKNKITKYKDKTKNKHNKRKFPFNQLFLYQGAITEPKQLIQLDVQLFEQQEETLELADNSSMQEILEYLVYQSQINLDYDQVFYEDARGLKLYPGTFASQIQIYDNKRLVKILKAPSSMIIQKTNI